MIIDLFNFFMIFIIIIIAFATIFFNLLNNSSPQYKTFFTTLRVLIEMMYGQVSFDSFKNNILIASILINIYTFFTTVLLLNLLIAMLTNTFNKINEKSSLENTTNLYFNYLALKPDKCKI